MTGAAGAASWESPRGIPQRIARPGVRQRESEALPESTRRGTGRGRAQTPERVEQSTVEQLIRILRELKSDSCHFEPNAVSVRNLIGCVRSQ